MIEYTKKFKHDSSVLQITRDMYPKKRIGWGEVHEGWYTLNEINKINKEITEVGKGIPLISTEGKEYRDRIIAPAKRILITPENQFIALVGGVILTEEIVDGKTEVYANFEAISDIEYNIPANYEIVSEDITRIELLEKFSKESFNKRAEIYPDYKLINAALGIYDTTEAAKIKKLCKDFRDEYYRLKSEVEKGNLDVTPQWPSV